MDGSGFRDKFTQETRFVLPTAGLSFASTNRRPYLGKIPADRRLGLSSAGPLGELTCVQIEGINLIQLRDASPACKTSLDEATIWLTRPI
jgi:hypothetical protein